MGNEKISDKQNVPLLDVSRSNQPIRDEIVAAMTEVIDSGKFVLGPASVQLESAVARICDAKHAVGCGSGSDALLLSLMAVDVQPGDEVIVPSFTFFATASAVWRLGAKPVFVDIEPDSFNLDPQLVKAAVTPATKAIIPVHLFGQCADMDPIHDVASEHGMAVIEDAAQAIGARYRDRPAGGLGDVGCFSFYPTKNLGGFGDAGMLTTSNDELAQRLKLLRGHGMHPRYYHQFVGINSRLDSVQAAGLNVKLTYLSEWTRQRQENAAHYHRLFQQASLEEVLIVPSHPDFMEHVWNQYSIRILSGQRDALREYLSQQGIGSEIYYPVPLHQQKCFQTLDYQEGSLPETERAAREVLSLPIFPELSKREQTTVVEQIGDFFRSQRGTQAA